MARRNPTPIIGPISETAPPAIAATGSAGTGVEASANDHTHAHGNQAAGGSLHAAASTTVAGFMSATDKVKLDALSTSEALSSRLINTTAPLTGGGDLTADRTLAISAATSSTAGSQSAADKAKQDTQLSNTPAALTSASNATPWAGTVRNAELDLTAESTTVGAISSAKVGETYQIRVKGATGKTVAFNAVFDFGDYGSPASPANGKVLMVSAYCDASGHFSCTYATGYSA